MNLRQLTCIYTNVDTLTSKVTELETLIETNTPDIVLLTETLPKNARDTDFWQPVLDKYSFFADNTGRGVGVFVLSSLNVQRRHDLETFKPSVVLQIGLEQDNLYVSVVYRSPNSTEEENTCLNKMINDLYSYAGSRHTCILAGDFNFPEIDWKGGICPRHDGHPTYKFFETITECGLSQVVSEPTHFRGLQNANILDLILSNFEDEVLDINYLPPLGKSHHVVLSFRVTGPSSPEGYDAQKFIMDKGNYIAMREEIGITDWNSILSDDLSVEESWKKLEDIINYAKVKYIPIKKTHYQSKQRKNTVPNSVLDKIRIKRRAFKMYKKYRTQENFNAYAKARNQVKWALRKAQKEKEIKIARYIKTDPKKFYAYVSSKTKPRETVANLLQKDGSLTKCDSEKAEVLNNFFTSVFTLEDSSNIPSFPQRTPKTLSTLDISVDNMKNKLKQLNTSKSAGPDNMHPRLLKELAEVIALPLKLLFDKTLKEGKIPAAWKKAEVKPIFKKGSKNDPGNYRPVSLTSIVCKVFEGIIRDSLNKHLLDNNLLSDHQYGFMSGRSCTTQLLTTINDWMLLLDDKKPVDVVYLDLQKAFDKVPHMRLLTKLTAYGVTGPIFEWIKDFLTNRTQFVTVGTENSPEVPVTSGVPQGSVLGPTLFIYFINDMPDTLDCTVKIFADDTKAYTEVQSTEQRDRLQRNIDNLLHWTNLWQIKFNCSKCKILHIGRKNPCYNYVMNGLNLQETKLEKDLGIYVDNNLTFEGHINEIVNKANRLVGMISRFITHKDKDIMVPLFKTLVRPVLEYGNAVWSPYLIKHINLLENIQRRFTKRIIGLSDTDYESRLRVLRLPSLEFRRLRGDMIETFKIILGLYDHKTTSTLFSIVQSSNTRGHPYKLIKRHVSTNQFAQFYTNRVINAWNSLPEHIVKAGSIDAFKNNIDNHWHKYMYTTNFKI